MHHRYPHANITLITLTLVVLKIGTKDTHIRQLCKIWHCNRTPLDIKVSKANAVSNDSNSEDRCISLLLINSLTQAVRSICAITKI